MIETNREAFHINPFESSIRPSYHKRIEPLRFEDKIFNLQNRKTILKSILKVF